MIHSFEYTSTSLSLIEQANKVFSLHQKLRAQYRDWGGEREPFQVNKHKSTIG